MFAGVVLAESIVTEKNVVAGQITCHAIGPVKHRHFNKDQILFAKIQFVTGFDYFEIPILVVMTFQ